MKTLHVITVTTAALLCLTGCIPQATGAPTPTTAPATTSSPSTPTTVAPSGTTPAWTADQQAAVDTVQKWYRIYNEALRHERGAGDFVQAARGDLFNDAARTYNEFRLAGLTAKGEMRISALTPRQPTEKTRRTVLVDYCLDTTGWQVIDESGKDSLKLEDKVIRPVVAKVEEWPREGWYVTSVTKGEQEC